MQRKPMLTETSARISRNSAQPIDGAKNRSRARVPQGSILEQNQWNMFRRFRSGTLPRSIAASFETSEYDVVRVVNERFDELMARRAA